MKSWQDAAGGHAAVAWTDEWSDPPTINGSYEIQYALTDVLATPTYEVSIGLDQTTSYTHYRDGSLAYPSGISVDYAATELSYSIPNLDTTAEYVLMVVGYHESSGDWKQIVEIDGKWKHQMKVTAGAPETLKVKVLPMLLKDGKLDIKIIKKTGDYAAIANLSLFKYEAGTSGKSGGAQTASLGEVGIQKTEFKLQQNRPNPFIDKTAISYQLANAGAVTLKIYNLTGALVKTVVNDNQTAGQHKAVWDGRDENGSKAVGGVYFYRLNANGKETTKRMTLLK